MTKKQWHRLFIKRISQILFKYVGNREDVSFVECGVKQGTASVIMATSLYIKGYLFDTWHGFPHFSKIDLTPFTNPEKFKERIENASDTYDDCLESLTKNGVIHLCTMIRGDILKTVPLFVEENKELSIMMLHIDTDLYEPAQISFDSFWPLMTEGGVVFFHDYGDKKWYGIKKVVDEFLSENNDSAYFHPFNKKKLRSCCLVKGKSEFSKSIWEQIVKEDQ